MTDFTVNQCLFHLYAFENYFLFLEAMQRTEEREETGACILPQESEGQKRYDLTSNFSFHSTWKVVEGQ